MKIKKFSLAMVLCVAVLLLPACQREPSEDKTEEGIPNGQQVIDVPSSPETDMGLLDAAPSEAPEKTGLPDEKEITVVREGMEEVFTGTLTVGNRYGYAIYLLPDYELSEADGFDLIAPKPESPILPEINMRIYEANPNTPVPDPEGEYGRTPLTEYRRFTAGDKTFEMRLTYPYESAGGGAVMLRLMAETMCMAE